MEHWRMILKRENRSTAWETVCVFALVCFFSLIILIDRLNEIICILSVGCTPLLLTHITKQTPSKFIFSLLAIRKLNAFLTHNLIFVSSAQKLKYQPNKILFNISQPNCHYMYRTVITICTTSLTFNNFSLCQHSVFMCFVWI